MHEWPFGLPEYDAEAAAADAPLAAAAAAAAALLALAAAAAADDCKSCRWVLPCCNAASAVTQSFVNPDIQACRSRLQVHWVATSGIGVSGAAKEHGVPKCIHTVFQVPGIEGLDKSQKDEQETRNCSCLHSIRV